MKYLLLFFCGGLYAQQLHHQMISSQGSTNITSNGLIVRATVGQSITGNSENNYVVQQGFQQNYWAKYIAGNKTNITTITYPNPFTDSVKFKFSEFVDKKLNIVIFDISGKQIVSETLISENQEISINLNYLDKAEYLVRLSANNFEYFTKIIKK